MWIIMSLGLSNLAARIRREDGQTMAEYAMLLALIVVVTVVVISLLGGSISSIFTSITGSLNTASGNS